MPGLAPTATNARGVRSRLARGAIGFALQGRGAVSNTARSVPQDWVYEGSPFTFVTDGLESALDQAKAVAGDKHVGVGAAGIVQQCIKAGLLDEIHVDLVHVLLGGGVSLFDHLGTGPIDLQSTRVIDGTGVTHLTFRVIK